MSPFQDIRNMIVSIPGPDEQARDAVRGKEATLGKPLGSLGRLEWFNEWLCAWQRRYPPQLKRGMVCVFAASHGVAQHDIAAADTPSPRAMLDAYAEGNAAVTQLCGVFGFGFRVFDLAVDVPSGDFAFGEALDEKSCVATMAYGMEAVHGGLDILALGSVSTGQDLAAAAVFTALYGGPAENWLVRDSGVDADVLARRAALIEQALTLHGPYLQDPLQILARLGGRDIAAMAGAILAARLQHIPVIIDGYTCTAAAAVLYAIHPATLDHCIAGSLSSRGAHREVLERIHKIPILALGIRAEDGCGAALAMAMVKAAVEVHNGMHAPAAAGFVT
ncbi:MAG: nicotinate-nucleotide--dimethylbenzimidazole phosphoribosyltransferase [Methylobacteriaceae bacterium]|nr:nicotinate-nucleotide--dimethylbenzimidazole phosphoribosyltransferase [Methylobacteriaceae bacterium]